MKEVSATGENKPYIFVSYAHKDSAKVMPLIRGLEERGVRIWYDEGIEAGTEWPAFIEERLEKCEGALIFLSNNSIDSVNCRNEVNVAAELKKEMLVAQLDEEVTYKYGMRLQLSSRQKIFCNRHNSAVSLIDEMLKLRMFAVCQEDAPAAEVHDDIRINDIKDTAKKSTSPFEKSKVWIIAASAIALTVLIAVLLVLLLPKGETPGDDVSDRADEVSSSAPASEESTSAPEPEIIELSDNLLDFTFELDGVVYKLPCAYSTFTANGWTISSSDYSDDMTLAGNSFESYYMSKNGRRILVYSYNMSGNAVKLSDCRIGGIEISVDDGADVRMSKGITPASSPDEIRAAFGTPNDSYSSGSYEQLTYWVNESEYNCVEFVCYTEGDESSVSIMNFVRSEDDNTVTNTEAPEYLSAYSKPTELGGDIFASVVSIEGDAYMLPAPVGSFVDKGWEIVSKPSYVVSGGSDAITLKKNNKEIYLYIINYAEYQTTAENCAVYKAEATENDGIDIALPGLGKPITLGMASSELAPLLPEKFSYYEGTTYDFYNYDEYRERDYSISIMVDSATGTVYKISISNETWDH